MCTIFMELTKYQKIYFIPNLKVINFNLCNLLGKPIKYRETLIT